MTARVHLELSGPMDCLRIAWQTGEALLDAIEFPEDPQGTRYNTLLAVQEMITNVLRHAHALDHNKVVRIEYQMNGEKFTVTIMDQGPEFDPRVHEPTVHDPDEMPTHPSGFGIMIATMVMNEIEYERRDGWNVLRMTKLVHEPVSLSPKPRA